jgi:DNA-binding MurR/RpiR family transcriptional regulator
MLELVALIEIYNTYDQGDIYYQISKDILNNYNSLDLSTLESFAKSLHISVSTANRFIHQVYFDNFSCFRNYVSKTTENYHFDGKYVPSIKDEFVNLNEFGNIICDNIKENLDNLEQANFEALISMIEESKEIVFIGIPITYDVWRLQMELILMGKKTSAFLDPNYQISEVDKVDNNSLVICLQHMRQQDNHNEMLIKQAKERGARAAYIGNVRIERIEEKVDISIIYRGTNTNVDIIMTQIYLSYIGNCLRNKII